MLPSEVIARADTQDLYIYDTVMSYKNYLQEKENNKNNRKTLNEPAPADANLIKQMEEWRASRGQK